MLSSCGFTTKTTTKKERRYWLLVLQLGLPLAMVEPALHVLRLSRHATSPVHSTPGAAGYSLLSAVDCDLPAGECRRIPLDGFAVNVPAGTYGCVAPCPALALRHVKVVSEGMAGGLHTEVNVVLFNHGMAMVPVRKGDRVAQLILQRHSVVPVCEVGSLGDTLRGGAGFGSTGVSAAAPAAASARAPRTLASNLLG